MAVFTSLETPELAAFLADYPCGALLDYAGIEAGIENTNYFVTLTGGEFVLTLFESAAPPDIDYCLGLMRHIKDRIGFAAAPVATATGALLGQLAGKPAALVERLAGRSIAGPGIQHCAAVGAAIARMHLACADYPGHAHSRGLAWRREMVKALASTFDPTQAEIARQVTTGADLATLENLPRGVIHGDLFRDNALFIDDRLNGLIDFYYAHTGAYLYDLAVTVVDWCYLPAARLRIDEGRALIAAYHTLRPLGDDERQAWLTALEAAAGRFWLSRHYDLHFPRSGLLGQLKDPTPFQHLLVAIRNTPDVFNAVLP